jgi:hypothetical protein
VLGIPLGISIASFLVLDARESAGRKRNGQRLRGFVRLSARLRIQRRIADALGPIDVEYLAPMLYLDVGFVDYAVLGGGESSTLENEIHRILPPSNLPLEAPDPAEWRRWVNKKADVQTIWCHVHYGTDVLATSDNGVLRRAADLKAIGADVQPLHAVAVQVEERAGGE